MDKRWLHNLKWSSWKVLSGRTFLFLVLFKKNLFRFCYTSWIWYGLVIDDNISGPNSFMAYIPDFTPIWKSYWYLHRDIEWAISIDDWGSNSNFLPDQLNHGLLDKNWIWDLLNNHCMPAYFDKSHSLDIWDLYTNP